MRPAELTTPAFLIDLPTFRRNAEGMQRRAQEWGVRLRPHVKTHKTLEGARIQTAGGFRGITVSTLAEVRHFKAGGFDDITFAFPLNVHNLPLLVDAARGIRLTVVIDHHDQYVALERCARREGETYQALMKIDCGYRRAGVEWNHPDLLTLAKDLDSGRWVRFQGVMTHAGHAYSAPNVPKIEKIVRRELETLARVIEKLRCESIECETVSIGSTPTLMQTDRLVGVTEIRPGNYVFFDQFQTEMRSCLAEDCAATVLTSVVSHYKTRNEMLVDAGALALSKDGGATHLRPEVAYGHFPEHPELKLAKLSQEHGIVTSKSSLAFEDFPLGSQLRLIPNHSCLTAACFPEYYVVEEGEVVDRWVPVRGWR